MTGPLPPDEQAKLDALYRERNGDPAQLASERYRPIPSPPAGPRRRTTPVQDYSAQHDELKTWIARAHPSWLPDLYTLRSTVAHIIIRRDRPTYAVALCGADGHPNLAPVIAKPCPSCAAYRR